MLTLARIILVCTALAGTVFFFQGIGVIGGSFMTGTTKWTWIGAAMAIGSALLLGMTRRPKAHKK